jgi:hypothetical protein
MVKMAPIDFAVCSASLHTAPSRKREASSATNNPSVVIGITVSVTCAVLAIGTVCFFIWKRRRAVKIYQQSRERPSELDEKPEWTYRKICELPVSEEVPPGYSPSSQRTPYRTTTLFEGEDVHSLGYFHQRVPSSFQKAVQSQSQNLRQGDIEQSPFSRIPRQTITDISTAAASSGSSKDQECSTPQQIYPYFQRTLLELPGMFAYWLP